MAIASLSGYAGRLADRIGPRLLLTGGAFLVAVAFAGMALTMPVMSLWAVTVPCVAVMALGMALLVSPLSSAVMLATPDADTGLASGINNAVARAAGLMAVAAMGALAGVVFSAVADGQLPGLEFGSLLDTTLAASDEALRVSASNRAFQAVAAISSVMCFGAALIAWLTQPHWRPGEKPTPD